MEKVNEDIKQDKIVIFNEVLDVMRAIYYIAKMRKKESDEARKQELARKRQENKGLNKDKDIEDISEEEPFIIFKELIIDAWRKYRPNSKEDTPEPNDPESAFDDISSNSANRKDIVNVLGQGLIKKILENMN